MTSRTTNLNTHILLMTVSVSCMTLTNVELPYLTIEQTYNIPSIITPNNPINNDMTYTIMNTPISTNTVHVNNTGAEDYEIIKSFAKNLLDNEATIDEDIQNVINDHFWEML